MLIETEILKTHKITCTEAEWRLIFKGLSLLAKSAGVGTTADAVKTLLKLIQEHEEHLDYSGDN